jgi:hypothetical protein
MGVVFEGLHRRLNLRVAIKVLRPELATAIAAERFLAEGRTLALISHPNVVRIFDAGEADGLLYFVMEFVEGETLAERLQRGPLPPAEVLRLAQDLLGALVAAHALGVVHRDIKPANIFLRRGRALLGDFGIARVPQGPDAGLTIPGQQIGTLLYMSPQQREGMPATMQSDVYAAGLVLWEACTGQQWPPYQSPESADWRGIPAALAPALRRALALASEDRWAGASELLHAIGASRRFPRWPLIGGGVLLAAAAAWLVLQPTALVSTPHRGAIGIAVERFRPGAREGSASLGDSVSAMLRRALEYPDFDVLAPGRPLDSATVRVSGSYAVTDGEIQMLARWAAGTVSDTVSAIGARADSDAVVETLASRLVRSLWRRDSLADVWLPVAALPSNEPGFDQWLRAEQYLAQARWEEASDAFRSAEAADSSCYLCTFRLLDIDRWLGRSHAPAAIARLRNGIDRFPSRYQTLIHAALTELPGRIDTLARAAAQAEDFFLASFEYGDELFHRGPLYGFPRIDAQEPFERTVRRRPRFGPGWEHLTWLLLSEGNARSAREALDRLLQLPSGSPDGFSAGMRVLLMLGYHWRFLPADSARRFSFAVLPALAGNRDAAAGGRLMMTADAPRGAVELGGLIARTWPDRADAVREGLLAQLYGYAALGRFDSLRATGAQLDRRSSDPALPLLALELEATLRAFDPEVALLKSPELFAALDAYAAPGTAHPGLAPRALLASGLLALRSGDSARLVAATDLLTRAPEVFGRILHAAVLGSRRDPDGALAALPRLPPLEDPQKHEAPLLDAMVRLLRAEQFEQRHENGTARNTLLWFEHLQTVGHGTGDPMPGEMAWAMGTLVRWRLAHLPGATGREQCSAYRGVARHWDESMSPFGSRADSAAAFVGRHCSQ